MNIRYHLWYKQLSYLGHGTQQIIRHCYLYWKKIPSDIYGKPILEDCDVEPSILQPGYAIYSRNLTNVCKMDFGTLLGPCRDSICSWVIKQLYNKN